MCGHLSQISSQRVSVEELGEKFTPGTEVSLHNQVPSRPPRKHAWLHAHKLWHVYACILRAHVPCKHVNAQIMVHVRRIQMPQPAHLASKLLVWLSTRYVLNGLYPKDIMCCLTTLFTNLSQWHLRAGAVAQKP